jgi:AcrR family transcriptional regulator
MSDCGSKRITQDQWLSKALELFAKTGEGGLRVENLARSLGVSKSGFYFHFKDRDDFLQQLLHYWAHEYTEVVTTNPLLLMTAPRDRLMMIATLVFEQNLTEFDAAMQVWANKDPDIARQVRKVIDVRLGFAGNALGELGFEGDDLTMRTRLFIGFLAVERQMFGPGKETAQRYRQRQLEMLLGK